MATTKGRSGDATVHVAATLDDTRSGEEAPRLFAYAFSPGGETLSVVPLDGGAAKLPVPSAKEAQAVRVVVGPEVDGEDAPALAELLRRGAQEAHLRLEPGDKQAKLELAVPRSAWLCWLLGRCTVRGTLLKHTTSGGVGIDLPVCGAEVEVYEVDPVWIIVPRIPDWLVDKLREVVLIPIPFPVPHDRPGPFPPGPGPDPGPIRELIAAARGTAGGPDPRAVSGSLAGDFVTRQELAQLAQERFAQQGEGRSRAAAAAIDAAEADRIVDLLPTPEPEIRLDAAAADVAALSESAELRRAAAVSAPAFRDALLRNPELVRPLLCWLFPRLVTKQLVATATTDECGHFRTTFWRGCSSDVPDLYFVAYRRFFGFRIPIYQPTPVACHTWWNYACGTEVTLYTTSPFAHTCAPCRPIVAPPRWVLVMAIGNHPLSRIHGTGAALSGSPSDVGLTDGGAPFGGLLRPRIEFDNALRDQLGVRYYRVSYKRAGSGNPWVPLDGEVHRHYAHFVAPNLVLEAYSLGPHVVNSEPALFEIPPALPPLGQWSLPDVVEDTTSAKFPTGGSTPPAYGLAPPAQAGIYKLRIELFDGAGAPVDISADAIRFVVPTSTDLSGTIHTTDAAALGLVPGPPVDTGNAFVMRLHVDNNPTAGGIDPPLLNGSVVADPHCGTLKYHSKADTVTIAYQATHPNGFAAYDFTLQQGVTPVTPPTVAGVPVGPGTVSSTPMVASLLDGCDVAGFAEALAVRGTATDGWSRQGYDASALRAFVLTKH